MKYLAFLTFFFSLFSSFCYAQWQIQNSGTILNLKDLHFSDSQNGWVVGNEGIILQTSNGGETWNQQNGGTDLPLRSVHFIDQDRGWITGGNFGNNIIIRTQNGGYTWDVVYSDLEEKWLNDVFFLDSTDGWVVGNKFYSSVANVILHTNDGGETWEEQAGPYENYSVYFVDSLNGWCVGGGVNGSTGYSYGYIYNTINGGSTWVEQSSGSNPDSFGSLSRVCFTDHYHGWAVGKGSAGASNIMQTTDGGINWEMNSSITEPFLTGVDFADTLHGWAVGGSYGISLNAILYTTNGGENWNHQFCETNNTLTSVFFIDQDNGWIVGDSGTILNTDNGGIVQIPDMQLSNSNGCSLFCFPNPLSNELTITWNQTKSAYTKMEIYNSNGKRVKELVGGIIPNGKHEYRWNTNNLLPGIYFIRLGTGNKMVAKKIIKH